MTPTATPTQPLDSGTTMSGKMADTMIGSRIRALKRSRKAASRSERGWPGRCPVSSVTFTVPIVPDDQATQVRLHRGGSASAVAVLIRQQHFVVIRLSSLVVA